MTNSQVSLHTLLIVVDPGASEQQLKAAIDSIITAEIFGQTVTGVFLSDDFTASSHLQAHLPQLLNTLAEASLAPALYWCSISGEKPPGYFEKFGKPIKVDTFKRLINDTTHRILNF